MGVNVGSLDCNVNVQDKSESEVNQIILNVKSAIKAMGDATLQRAQMLRAGGEGNAVPYKTGLLQSTGVVEVLDDGLKAIVEFGNGIEYAAYQEFGQRKDGSHVVRNYTTPGTGPHYLRDAGNSVKKEGIKNYL